MKKINNKFLLVFTVITTLVFTSCGEQENVQYDAVNGLTLISFATTSTKIPVKPTEVSSTDIKIEVSTLSTSERTFTVVVDESSTATSDQYTISDFTVPAGEFIGSGTVTGVYSALPAVGPVALVLKLTGIDGKEASIDSNIYTIGLERFCAFDIADFYGTYDVVENGQYKYEVVATAGPVANTLYLSNLYETNGTTVIELDNSNLSSPKVILRSVEFDAALYVSATYGNVWANAFASTTPSTFNVCSQTIDIFFRRSVSVGSFAGETNCVMTKI
jgi:hypothetical protein|tara:strand:+ start:34 stop:858 length:825 start_codon:yes stop_codon:yes gene_type:complete